MFYNRTRMIGYFEAIISSKSIKKIPNFYGIGEDMLNINDISK